MLLFKKKFLAAIRSGEKTQTVRLWEHCRMRAGQRSYIPGVGYIQVSAVDVVTLESLNDYDAQLDGFPTADALRGELAVLYADQLAAGHQVYRVRFAVLGAEEQLAATAERRTRKGQSPKRQS